MVDGLKPVDDAIIGNPPDVSIFEILPKVNRHNCLRIRSHAEDSLKKIARTRFQLYSGHMSRWLD